MSNDNKNRVNNIGRVQIFLTFKLNQFIEPAFKEKCQEHFLILPLLFFLPFPKLNFGKVEW